MENQTPSPSVLQPTHLAEKPAVMKSFPGKKKEFKAKFLMFMATLLVVLAGVATGWTISGAKIESSNLQQNSQVEVSDGGKTVEGILDESVKYTEAEGLLVEGGIKGEGTHHLERGIGPSQYAYLTSTSINIDPYIGKKVKVWGETISGKEAPWLMDVVKIQILD